MKTVQLSGSPRASVGKKDAKAVRNAGNVPCVLYGTGEQTTFAVKHTDLEKIVFSPDVYQIEINIDGTTKKGIIQDLQMHPVTDKIQHVDFLELVDDKPVKVGIPVSIVGRSRGVMNGGRLQQVFRRIKVEGLPKDLPATVELDITPLRIGQAIRIGQIEIPGCKVLDPASAVAVSVKMARGAVNDADDDEEEEAAEA